MTPDPQAAQERVRAAVDELDAAVRARDRAVHSVRSEGVSAIAIAEQMNVTREMVYRILKRK